MMKCCLAGMCAAVFALSGCGVDGEPTPPPPKETSQQQSGIRISGDVRAGISVTRDGRGWWAAKAE